MNDAIETEFERVFNGRYLLGRRLVKSRLYCSQHRFSMPALRTRKERFGWKI